MQIHFVGRHLTVTSALKEYTTEKLQPLSKRYSHIDHVHITFHIENVTQIVEANVSLNGTEIHATGKADDMYHAIDILAEKLLGQITKHKEKISEHR